MELGIQKRIADLAQRAQLAAEQGAAEWKCRISKSRWDDPFHADYDDERDEFDDDLGRPISFGLGVDPNYVITCLRELGYAVSTTTGDDGYSTLVLSW